MTRLVGDVSARQTLTAASKPDAARFAMTIGNI